MLRLTARHADAWNRDFNPAGSIAELPDWGVKVDAACEAEGRDPSTLARYAAVLVEVPGASPEGGQEEGSVWLKGDKHHGNL